MADDVKNLNEEQLKSASGGFGVGDAKCPNCGSQNLYCMSEHDEICQFRCQDCGNIFTHRY